MTKVERFIMKDYYIIITIRFEDSIVERLFDIQKRKTLN